MPNVSVVICAYTEKRWQDLVAAVDSVKHQLFPPQEIIVVIDHNPVLLDLARSAFEDEVVVQNNGPRGLSGARNYGISVASGEVVVRSAQESNVVGGAPSASGDRHHVVEHQESA